MGKYRKKPKIFIMGLSSFVGYHLAKKLREKFTVVGCYFYNPVHLKDVHAFPVSLKNDTEMLERLLALQAPDYAISCVGIFNPKLLIENQKISENINISLPVAFSLMASRNHAKHILISCAEVFDGRTGNYDENAKDFIGYGVGKMRATAEAYIRSQTMEGTTVRIGRVLGLGLPYRPTFLDRLRQNLQAGVMFHANPSRTYSYISLHSVCDGVERLLLNPFPQNRQRAVHLGGPKATEAEMGQVLAMSMGLSMKYLKTDESQTTPEDFSLNSIATETSLGWKEESREALLKNVIDSVKPGISQPQYQLKVVPKLATARNATTAKPKSQAKKNP